MVPVCGGREARVPLRLFASVVLALAFTAVANGGGDQTVRAHGIALTVPGWWHRVASAGDGPVTDPRTLLVVGTAGVAPKSTHCQIASYRVPARGAVVVVVGWKTAKTGGEAAGSSRGGGLLRR